MFHTILFDIIGTTVKEKNDDTVTNCIHKAFEDHTGPVNSDLIRKNRGRDKISMITEVLNYHNYSLKLLLPIYNSFQTHFADSLHDFSENDGCSEVFYFLKNKGVKIGIGTGLSKNLLEMLMNYLQWRTDQFDYIGIAGELPNSRPAPDMIFDMMRRLNLKNGEGFLKVGDTVADIQEGKNANVATAVILSGTQNENLLLDECPDFALHSLYQIKNIIDAN